MKSLKQVWAAAQRNPCAKRPSSGIGAEPKATITILINFDRTFILIPTGCALRCAQKDEGGFPQPPYIPLDSHTPFGTLGRYKTWYSGQAPFAAHACEQVATVLLRPETGAV